MCSCTHTRVTPFPWNDCFLFCFLLRSLPKPQKNALGNANTSSQHHTQLTNGCSPLKTRCNNFCFFRCRNTISIISNLQCCLFFFFFFYTRVSFPPFWQRTKGSKMTATNYCPASLAPTEASEPRPSSLCTSYRRFC